METFFLRLAVAVIPLVLFVTLVIILDSRTRKSFALLCLRKSRCHPILRSFAVAATLRWF